MKRVVLPPEVPPLRTSSFELTLIGFDSGNWTSTVVWPVPMIDFLHAFSAALVSVAWIWPDLQTGTPLVLMVPFLSVSTTTSFSAGGCVPSLVAILPDALSVIGASFFFGRVVGLNPPLKVNRMFPASAVTGFSPAAVAMPARLTAIRAPKAIVNIEYLRISLVSLLYRPARPRAAAVESLAFNISPAGQTTTRAFFVNPSVARKVRRGSL